MASRAAKRLGERVFAYGSAIGNVGGHVPWRVRAQPAPRGDRRVPQPPTPPRDEAWQSVNNMPIASPVHCALTA